MSNLKEVQKYQPSLPYCWSRKRFGADKTY